MYAKLSKKVIFLVLMVFGTLYAVDSHGRVRYVSIKGADTNSGTIDLPYRTVQKAANEALPGDKIIVTQGMYNEFVTIMNSGTLEARIVFEGERGSGGEFKTIIDPSIFCTGWKLAPEVGAGVYKISIGFDPKEMTVEKKRIGRIKDSYMEDGTGFDILKKAANSEVYIPNTDKSVQFWDGIEALYGYLNNITYIRFRNNDNPDEKDIRAAPVGDAINISNKSCITIKDFLIRGARSAIYVTGKQSQYNIIENNYLMNGGYRIFFQNGPAYNVIRKNEITMNYFGYDSLGAGSLFKGYEYLVKMHVYYQFKYMISPHFTSDDIGIDMINVGDDNEICDNHIFGGLLGITGHARDVAYHTNGIKIHNNIIHNMSSVGYTALEGVLNAEFYNNYVYDCNINIRLQKIADPETLERSSFIYRNRLWNPPGTGFHLYAHSNSEVSPTVFPKHYIYHNSFAGGNMFMGVVEKVLLRGGMPQTYFLNNIVSSSNTLTSSVMPLVENKQLGMFDYNWIGGYFSKEISLSSLGEHNILRQNQAFWDQNNLPDFTDSTNDALVVSAGIDLSKPNIFSKSAFSILPGIKAAYFSGPKPSLGAIQFGYIVPPPPSNLLITH